MTKAGAEETTLLKDDCVSHAACQAVHEYLARPGKRQPQGECSAGHPTAPRHAQRRARTFSPSRLRLYASAPCIVPAYTIYSSHPHLIARDATEDTLLETHLSSQCTDTVSHPAGEINQANSSVASLQLILQPETRASASPTRPTPTRVFCEDLASRRR